MLQQSGSNKIIQFGVLFGLAAVILGAFGAHGLAKILEPSEIKIFKTGVEYQFYHSFAILVCGLLNKLYSSNNFNRSAYFFALGILLFSGSLYLLSFRILLAFIPLGILGPITPIGGLLFIIGWWLMFNAVRKLS